MTTPNIRHIPVSGIVTRPDDGTTCGLYRATSTGIYLTGDERPGRGGISTAYRSCPQDWARAQHMRGMVRSSTLTRDQIAKATGITRRALDNYMLPDGSSGHRRPPMVAVTAVEALCGSEPWSDEPKQRGAAKKQ